jgi:hypothetical protein
LKGNEVDILTTTGENEVVKLFRAEGVDENEVVVRLLKVVVVIVVVVTFGIVTSIVDRYADVGRIVCGLEEVVVVFVAVVFVVVVPTTSRGWDLASDIDIS